MKPDDSLRDVWSVLAPVLADAGVVTVERRPAACPRCHGALIQVVGRRVSSVQWCRCSTCDYRWAVAP